MDQFKLDFEEFDLKNSIFTWNFPVQVAVPLLRSRAAQINDWSAASSLSGIPELFPNATN